MRVTLFVILVCLCGCAAARQQVSEPQEQLAGAAAPVDRRPLTTRYSESKPEWTSKKTDDTPESRYFTGYAAFQDDSEKAVEKAIENALGKIAKTLGEDAVLDRWEMRGGGKQPHTITAHFLLAGQAQDIDSIRLEDRYWRCARMDEMDACEGFALVSIRPEK